MGFGKGRLSPGSYEIMGLGKSSVASPDLA